MQHDNKPLYESDEVVGKYAANNTRVRSLNNPEKDLIDRFDVKNKDVLVIGCGAGRVPANLLLYGNRAVGVDRSQKLYDAAVKNFPQEKFADLKFVLADATDLQVIPNESFDVVIFPMNSIDYLESLSLRHQAIQEAVKKLRKGGLLTFSSHNKLAYALSPKVSWKDRSFVGFSKPFVFAPESAVGGGVQYKGNPKHIIDSVEKLTGCSFVGFTCDTRNKLDRLFARKLSTAQYIFPYLLYVFKK